METCKNCKYWNNTTSIQSPSLRRCLKVKMFWEVTEWVDDNDDISRELIKEHKNDKAFAQDGSDYKAVLITTEDYGCNQYITKN